eukprot:COSAG01_NODE_53265_length_340_cov_1.244813_2_plen_42_part_01
MCDAVLIRMVDCTGGGGGGYRGPAVLQTSGWDYLACTTEVHP